MLKQQQDLQQVCEIVAQQATSAIDPEYCRQLHTNFLFSWSITFCQNLHSQANRAQENCKLLLESNQIGCSQVYGSK